MTQRAPGWGRQLRQAFNRLRALRAPEAPDAPAQSFPPPWPGDPARGARLVKGELELGGAALSLSETVFEPAPESVELLRVHLHGFSWLRDLHALGTDAARARARAVVLDFLDTPKPDPVANFPEVMGARLAAWLGYYDFFAASANDEFRQLLMHRLVLDARHLAVALPPEALDERALTALKGLAAAALAMPEHAPYMVRVLKLLSPELVRQFFPDGVHVTRSPAVQLAALRELVELRTLLKAAATEAPPELAMTIERAAAGLRALRHGDGGLALFNGAREGTVNLVDLVLGQAGRARGPLAVLNASGFVRLSAGKSLVLVDAGPPAAPGLDRFAHAGTLSFEFSIGKERIITNCGAAPLLGGGWADALRASAAHSTLVMNEISSSDVMSPGLGRRPAKMEVQRHLEGGISWLEATHDGWTRVLGSIHRRCLGLAESGDELLGLDFVEGITQPYTVRFHLHPSVAASLQEDNATVLLRTPSGLGLRFRSAGLKVSLEESIYFGGSEPRRSEQIVLAGHQDGPQMVRWSLTKV